MALRDEVLPFALVGEWAGGGAIIGSNPVAVAAAADDPFALLDRQPAVPGSHPEAVGGGWFGWLGYQLGALIDQFPPTPPRPVPLPHASLAFYDHLLRLDRDGRWWFEALSTEDSKARLHDRLDELRRHLAAPVPASRDFATTGFRSRPSDVGHQEAVRACVDYIAQGDLYQANLCLRIESEWQGSGIDLFARTATSVQPAYGAYLADPGGGEVVSLSPELFLRREGRTVVTRPIKGTAARNGDPAAALAGSAALRESAKDRAENVMIVDLMRNDLGRSCEIGSVEVTQLAELEAHPGLWHLVSEVRGRLADGVGDGLLVRNAFPPGSVTGAPKIKAMEVIATLESSAREVYTGAIGFASPCAGLELSVAIRTFELRDGRIWIGAGGGVVADSRPDAESRECLDKARPLIAAAGGRLEADVAHTLKPTRPIAAPVRHPRPDSALGVFETLLVAQGRPIELAAHVERLSRSVQDLYGMWLADGLAATALEHAAGVDGPARMRLRFEPGGTTAHGVEIEVEPLPERTSFPGTAIALRPLAVPGGLGEHKWIDRSMLEAGEDARAGACEALIIDLDGTALETARGNLFVIEGAQLVTPPLDGRILPGVTRAAIARLAGAVGLDFIEEELAPERLDAAAEAFVASSLRGIQSIARPPGRGREPHPITDRLAWMLRASWFEDQSSKTSRAERSEASSASTSAATL